MGSFASKSCLQRWRASGGFRLAGHLLCALLACSPAVQAAPIPADKPASHPAWWFEREVIRRIDPNNAAPLWAGHDYPAADDFAAANLGQLKLIATKAAAELNARLPGGAGLDANNLIAHWTTPPDPGVTRDDFAALNLGQLKAVASLFHDRLISRHFAEAYPWAGGQADDFALANLGQVKHLFGFDVAFDSDSNGLPDWWEQYYFGALGVNPNTLIPDAGGLTIGSAFQQGKNPHTGNDDSGNPGAGGGGGGGTPKDRDDDGVPDDQDAYPFDHDRTRDVPATALALINMSKTTTANYVNTLGFDDDGNAAFGFTTGAPPQFGVPSGEPPVHHIYLWKNGVITPWGTVLFESQTQGTKSFSPDPMHLDLDSLGTFYGQEGLSFGNSAGTTGFKSQNESITDLYPPNPPYHAYSSSGSSILPYMFLNSTGCGTAGGSVTVPGQSNDTWSSGGGIIVTGSKPVLFDPTLATSGASIPNSVQVVNAYFDPRQANHHGQAIGYDHSSSSTHSAFWNGGQLITLPDPAQALNEQGYVIGSNGGYNLSDPGDGWLLREGATPTPLKDLLPAVYQKQVKFIRPFLISNVNADGAFYIKCYASILEGPGAGQWVGHDNFMLKVNPAGESEISVQRVPDPGISIMGYGNGPYKNGILSSNGTLAVIGTPIPEADQKTFAALLLPVEVKEAWSDQLPDVKVNWMPNGTGWAEKPYIFMSVRADGKAYAKAKVAVGGPPELRNKILWRIAKGNGSGGYTPMSGDSSYDASGEVVTIIRDFPDDDPDQNYILVGGYDQDGDGYLSTSEANIIPTCKHKPPGQNAQPQTLPFTFKVVSKPKYEESRAGALGITNVASTFSGAGWSNAGDLLAKFATSANPSFDSPSAGYESLDRLGTDNEGVKRGMSHPVGVLFQPVAGRGQTIRAYYASQTLFATDFLRSRAFQIELTAFLNGKAELLKTLATPAPGNTKSFAMSGDLNFRNDITLASPRADLNMLFGMGRCRYELTIAVDFEERGNVVVVTDVRVSGRAVDLYDFDYDDDLLGVGFVKKAARVQSGYNTAGSGGRVITTELDFDEESVPAFGWQVSK